MIPIRSTGSNAAWLMLFAAWLAANSMSGFNQIRGVLWVKPAVLLALLLCVVPASAHDWYTDLKVPGTEMLCCSQKDCHPVPDEESPGGEELKILIEGTWFVVAPNWVLGMFSPDGLTHACWGHVAGRPVIRCVIRKGAGV